MATETQVQTAETTSASNIKNSPLFNQMNASNAATREQRAIRASTAISDELCGVYRVDLQRYKQVQQELWNVTDLSPKNKQDLTVALEAGFGQKIKDLSKSANEILTHDLRPLYAAIESLLGDTKPSDIVLPTFSVVLPTAY
jgi:hypothetical protein